MKIKATMSIQNAPFENIIPEIEIDTEDMENTLKLIDKLYSAFHNRHINWTPESEKKD